MRTVCSMLPIAQITIGVNAASETQWPTLTLPRTKLACSLLLRATILTVPGGLCNAFPDTGLCKASICELVPASAICRLLI